MTGYYFREAITGILRAKFPAFVTVVILATAVFFSAVTAGLYFYSGKIENKIKDNVQLRLFTDNDVEELQYDNIISQVKNTGHVAKVRFISKEEAAQDFIKETGNDFIEILGNNPLPATLVVSVKNEDVSSENLEKLAASLTSISGIESAEYDYDATIRLLYYLQTGKTIVFIVSAFLIILAVYMIYLTNKLIIEAKFEQYNTMKLVGAGLFTIKFPLFLRGAFLGLIAALFIEVIFYGFYTISFNFAIPYSLSYHEFRLLTAVVFISGIIFGAGGSFFAAGSINNKLRLK